ncbi:hypothetical protein COCOR_00863 [Corallococcus coralloides DSM 2259]|uniref:Uncharacterized protein n=1 Tax=Corallococcus coralloides (strain ATCC 25202 / DSM 2259 / NBRC 100086 / M2) TaxID=1144275 RepID=H8MK31_CORCM|nr:hypothetical protein [Corallococcus coralloides]AFE03751.1 hypothetical protein COCOR_00863 [Corallococcus coralloides DSM 2259]
MTPSTEDLLAIARLYWGADQAYIFRQEPSPEDLRYEALWDEKNKEGPRWGALLRELRKELPDCKVCDYTPPLANPSFGALVYPPYERIMSRPQFIWTVAGYLSILAPVYTVHCVRHQYVGKRCLDSKVFLGPIPLELRSIAEVVAQRIEAEYGATALPLEVAQTPVPLYVNFMKPPETTLFHALFTSEPWNIP